MKTLFMETTAITSEKTISQIESVLVRNGATAVLKECAAGSIDAVSFKITLPSGDIPFRLPCRWQAIETVLAKRNRQTWMSETQKFARREKAKRIAWRQILRWVEAQMALVETNMVKVQEVFFPYIQAPSGQTLYEIQEQKQFALGPGN